MVISIIFLLGGVHGLCLATLLAFKKVNAFPNRLLSLLMLVFSIDLGMAAVHTSDWITSYPHLVGIDYPLTLLYGPLLFLYVKSLSKSLEGLSKRDMLHFLPFLLLLLYMMPFYFEMPAVKLQMLGSPVQNSRSFWFVVINHLKVIHGVGYIGVVVWYLHRYRKSLKHTYSTMEKVNLDWLRNFIAAASVLASIATVIHIVSTFEATVVLGFGEKIYGEITLLAVTLFVYGIGYMGLNQPEVFVNPSALSGTSPGTVQPDRAHINTSSSVSYQKSGLDETTALRQLELLVQAMEEEKIYRQSDLNLSDLADTLELSPHNVTEIINRYLGKNFYDFVNAYRVNEVKRRLDDPAFRNLTLLAIGLEAGFNSKSTFNSVFKKSTGLTPSQYRDRADTKN